jgi:hypothetical protein
LVAEREVGRRGASDHEERLGEHSGRIGRSIPILDLEKQGAGGAAGCRK